MPCGGGRLIPLWVFALKVIWLKLAKAVMLVVFFMISLNGWRQSLLATNTFSNTTNDSFENQWCSCWRITGFWALSYNQGCAWDRLSSKLPLPPFSSSKAFWEGVTSFWRWPFLGGALDPTDLDADETLTFVRLLPGKIQENLTPFFANIQCECQQQHNGLCPSSKGLAGKGLQREYTSCTLLALMTPLKQPTISN